MVSQDVETMMTSPAKAEGFIRIEAADPRSDNRRRVVFVAREAVTIRRAVSGVTMAIRIESCAYRGVALRITALEEGRFRYEVRLAHRDPDLSVPLGEGEDLASMEAQWREWVAFLRLPALAGRSEATDALVNLGEAELTRRIACARRRGDALRVRRPRFLKRRAVSRSAGATIATVDPDAPFHAD